MKIFKGKSTVNKIVEGTIHVIKRAPGSWRKETVSDTEKEVYRFNEARAQVMSQLERLYSNALEEVGEESALIFEVHRLMCEDLDYIDEVEGRITGEMVNAEYAVTVTGEEFAAIFTAMDDEYMQGRAVDVLNISARIVRALEGAADEDLGGIDDAIVMSDDLSPGEILSLHRMGMKAFVISQGGLNSHNSILAASMNIPFIAGCDMEIHERYHGTTAIVDCLRGEFIMDPDGETRDRIRSDIKELLEEEARLKTLIGEESITTDGRRIAIYANVMVRGDVDQVLANDGEGIGLFRSEFLYLERDDYPTEEEQFEVYREVLSRMGSRRVIIRTLDIGADKKTPYFELEDEANPALGLRAIRLCLARVDVFKTQLRAMMRASVYGNLAIMFPMIISVEELRKAKAILEEVKSDLKVENIAFKDVETGIMVETPAAALETEELAKEADFFSIGTNDLTQYTLAIDRQNEDLGSLYDSHHPAVLKLIRMSVDNARKAGIKVGICGELAGDTSLTAAFIDMGVDVLSVSPGKILSLRDTVRGL